MNRMVVVCSQLRHMSTISLNACGFDCRAAIVVFFHTCMDVGGWQLGGGGAVSDVFGVILAQTLAQLPCLSLS